MKRTLFISVLLIVSFQTIQGQGLFPELRGYKISDDYPVYTPDDLWNYINGAADAYLQLGFIDLNIREYVKGKNIIKAEIYRFGDDAGLSECTPWSARRYKFINTGVQGYNEEGVVHFYKDCFYVKIMSHSLSAKVNSSMLDLATLISSRMGGSGEFPALLRLFPSEGLLENQETYLLEVFWGTSFCAAPSGLRTRLRETGLTYISSAVKIRLKLQQWQPALPEMHGQPMMRFSGMPLRMDSTGCCIWRGRGES